MAFNCMFVANFTVGLEKTYCRTKIKLISITEDGIHSGNIQSKFNIQYQDGSNEDWIFQYPSSRFHLSRGTALEVVGATSTMIMLGIKNNIDATSPTPGPAPTGQKEYVFEFSGSLSGLSKTAIAAINKIVQLLGGKTAYIEGNKIVVVM